MPSTPFYDMAFLTDLQGRGIITNTFLRLNPSRREAIVTGILEEAAFKGPTKLNIKEAARRAGVSVGSLYQYFNHREGLLDFAIEITTKQMVAAFSEFKPYLSEKPLHEALSAYLQGGDEIAKEYTGYVQFFASAAYQGDPVLTERVVRPVAQAMLEMTRAILEKARSRGEVRSGIDFEATVRLVNTLVIAVYDAQFLSHLNTYYQLTDKNIKRERILESMLDLIESALRG